MTDQAEAATTCTGDCGSAYFDQDDDLWRCTTCDGPIDADGECPTSRDSGSYDQ